MLACAEVLLGNKYLTDIDTKIVKKFFVSVDKFHLTDAGEQLTLRNGVELLIISCHAAPRRHRAGGYEYHLVMLRVEICYFFYKASHALHMEHSVGLRQYVGTYLDGYCHGWFLRSVNCV